MTSSALNGQPPTWQAVAESDASLPLRPARHTAWWIGAGVLLLIAAAGIWVIATNPRFGWHIVGSYLFSRPILTGLGVTVELTVIAMAIGLVIGILLASMRMSPNPVVRACGQVYIWFFRGTPVLVQLIFWFYLAALFPVIRFSSLHIGLADVSTNSVIDPFTAAILGLGLNEGAYMAEIVRAGILSVGSGQSDAARALGLTRRQAMVKIILPQAMRVVIPPTGNETIGMLKTTALVSVIALADLLYSAQQIYSVNYETIPLLITVSIWYLLLTSILTMLQRRIEDHYGKGIAAIGARPARRLAMQRNGAIWRR